MASRISFSAKGNPLAALATRLRDLRPALIDAIKAWRSVGAEEFSREAWNRPARGFRPWPPTLQFGNTPPPPKTLQRTGALLSAWMGGPGGFEVVTAQEAAFGIRGSVARYGVVHRGGSGDVLSAQANIPEQIQVTPRMRIYLGLVKGVWLKASTRFIVIPRRPHFTRNPEAQTRVTAILAAYVAGREVPGRLTA